MGTILTWVLSTLTGPALKAFTDAYKAKLASQNTQEQLAAGLATRELEVQQAEVQAQYNLRTSEIGHFWEPEKLAMYIVLAFMGKVIIWDTMFGLGTTVEIKGEVAVWMNLIMSFYFSKRGIENVARIISSRWGR